MSVLIKILQFFPLIFVYNYLLIICSILEEQLNLGIPIQLPLVMVKLRMYLVVLPDFTK
jgi:hypothetical protein